MILYLLQGFLIGLAYVAPIGTQNLYVINTALSKSRLKAIQTALITSLWDIILALICFYGMGYFIEKSVIIKDGMLLIGSLFIIILGISLLVKKVQINEDLAINSSLIKIIIACFVVTFLNPQAIIDGTLLLGGIRASLPLTMSTYFIVGSMIASLLWFLSLAFFISFYHTKLNKESLTLINLIASLVMIFYGLKLGFQFILIFFH